MHEIRALTGIRGIASLYVVLFHYMLGLGFSNPATTVVAHGYLAVDLFFVLSGFVMALTYTRMFAGGWLLATHLRFLGRRIARIYPLYLVTTLVATILLSNDILQALDGTSLRQALPINLLMLQTWGLSQSLNGPAWSISAEWAAYIVFPLLLLPCLQRSRATAWVTALICIAVIMGLTQVPASTQARTNPAALLDVTDSYLALPVLRCLAEFCLGLMTFRVARSPFGIAFARRRWTASLIALGILVLLAIPRTDLAVVLLCPPLILALSGEAQPLGRLLGTPPIELLGKLSYSIYLIHFLMLPVVGWLHSVADHRNIAHGQSIGAASALVLTFIVSALAYRFIEVPGRVWLRKILEGTSRPQVA